MSDVGLDEGGIAQAISSAATGLVAAFNQPVITRTITTAKTNKKGKLTTKETLLTVSAAHVLLALLYAKWVALGRPNIRKLFHILWGSGGGLGYEPGGLGGYVLDTAAAESQAAIDAGVQGGLLVNFLLQQAAASGDPARLAEWEANR